MQAHFYHANLADRSKFTEGKYLGLDGSGTVIWIGESANHFYTDYIPVSEGDVICASFRFMTCFDADKALVASESINVEKIEYVYTVPSGVSYIVYSYYTDKIDTYMVNYGETLLPYVPYSKMLIKKECVEEYLPDMTECEKANKNARIAVSNSGGNALKASAESLASGAQITFDNFPKDLKKGLSMTFYALFDSFTSVTVGKGLNDYRGDALRIDATSIHWLHYNDASEEEVVASAEHGLTVSTFLAVAFCVDSDSVCRYVVNTLGGSFTGTFQWGYNMNGTPFVIAEQDMTGIEFGAVANDISCPVWLFGDSYFGVGDTRVMGHLKNLGYMDNCLVCGCAGMGSTGGYTNLENLIALGGMPRFLVWCEGMNDSVEGYRAILKKLVELQKQYGFELILYRVPTVPARMEQNNGINALVEASGYRCIDAKKAVGADDEGNWYADYLSSDGVHPSVAGAKAIATRMVIDVPEIMQYGKSEL